MPLLVQALPSEISLVVVDRAVRAGREREIRAALDEGAHDRSGAKAEAAADVLVVQGAPIVPHLVRAHSVRSWLVERSADIPKVRLLGVPLNRRASVTIVRCLTEDMGQRPLRSDIPLNLTDLFKEEARGLRNKLLLFRFRNGRTPRELPELSGLAVEPRVKQVLAPLFALGSGSRTAVALEFLAIRLSDALRADRASSVEGEILEVIRELRNEAPAVSLREVAHRATARFGAGYENVTPRWVGSILRQRLGLTPRKSHGTYVLPLSEYPKLDELFSRYGLGRVGLGD